MNEERKLFPIQSQGPCSQADEALRGVSELARKSRLRQIIGGVMKIDDPIADNDRNVLGITCSGCSG